MENKIIKVVWLCHFSNPFVHEKLQLRINPIVEIVKKMFSMPVSLEVSEFANWITNGIAECERISEVELHIVSPYRHLRGLVQEFRENGVYYHFFHNEDDDFVPSISRRIFHKVNHEYRNNCRIIEEIINSIHPQIIHLFGAENPHYSLGVFGNYGNVITIAQLQTLMNDPEFKRNYPIDDESYYYRANIEKSIIRKTDYIGTKSAKYRQIIKNVINPDAIFLNTCLALTDPIVKDECEKFFDFVYFSANLNKAADLAIEAFGLAYQTNPNITLDVIGGYDNSYKEKLDEIINKYNIKNAVSFEGMLPTHKDVLDQIRKSRFALLPLRIDLTSGTIREAMSNGLPVITTDTGEMGTQKLNIERQNVLLSRIGDHQALADNILRIKADNQLAKLLRENSYLTRMEVGSNKDVALKYVMAYKACLEWQRNSITLPKEVTEI